MINLTVNEIKGYKSSQIAQKENNDCFVRALAAASGSSYDAAHKVAKEVFGREDRKGTQGINIATQMLKAEENGLDIEGVTYDVKVLGKEHTKNMYKLYGELVWRQKTVKSFIKDHQKGNYIVTVANHAFAIKDGKLVDNFNEEFRPTRKVQAAYKIVGERPTAVQLSLF